MSIKSRPLTPIGSATLQITAIKSILTVPLFLLASAAIAGPCDYRPSSLISGLGAGAAATTGGAVAAAGAGAKAAGFYTLTHAVTGATMLGSTAGGASAAGTVGIMGGTGGLIGSAAAILMAPATIVTGALVGVGVMTYEGVCYFTIERIDEPEVIREVVENLASNSDPEFLKLSTIAGADYLLIAEDHDDSLSAVSWARYKVDNLYIEEGMLIHKDLGPNTQIGHVTLVGEAAE